MKLILLLSLAATCPETLVSSILGQVWLPMDQEVMELNRGFCVRKYSRRSPCVTKFIKMGYRRYHIMCGSRRGRRGEVGETALEVLEL